jgi:hypothetical protein
VLYVSNLNSSSQGASKGSSTGSSSDKNRNLTIIAIIAISPIIAIKKLTA